MMYQTRRVRIDAAWIDKIDRKQLDLLTGTVPATLVDGRRVRLCAATFAVRGDFFVFNDAMALGGYVMRQSDFIAMFDVAEPAPANGDAKMGSHQ